MLTFPPDQFLHPSLSVNTRVDQFGAGVSLSKSMKSEIYGGMGIN